MALSQNYSSICEQVRSEFPEKFEQRKVEDVLSSEAMLHVIFRAPELKKVTQIFIRYGFRDFTNRVTASLGKKALIENIADASRRMNRVENTNPKSQSNSHGNYIGTNLVTKTYDPHIQNSNKGIAHQNQNSSKVQVPTPSAHLALPLPSSVKVNNSNSSINQHSYKSAHSGNPSLINPNQNNIISSNKNINAGSQAYLARHLSSTPGVQNNPNTQINSKGPTASSSSSTSFSRNDSEAFKNIQQKSSVPNLSGQDLQLLQQLFGDTYQNLMHNAAAFTTNSQQPVHRTPKIKKKEIKKQNEERLKSIYRNNQMNHDDFHASQSSSESQDIPFQNVLKAPLPVETMFNKNGAYEPRSSDEAKEEPPSWENLQPMSELEKESVKRLNDLGFSQQKSLETLRKNNGDLFRTRAFLFEELRDLQEANIMDKIGKESEVTAAQDIARAKKENERHLPFTDVIKEGIFSKSIFLDKNVGVSVFQDILTYEKEGFFDLSQSDLREEAIKLLVLESKSVKWYGLAANSYMYKVINRLNANCSLENIEQEVTKLKEILYHIPKRSGDMPQEFIDAVSEYPLSSLKALCSSSYLTSASSSDLQKDDKLMFEFESHIPSNKKQKLNDIIDLT